MFTRFVFLLQLNIGLFYLTIYFLFHSFQKNLGKVSTYTTKFLMKNIYSDYHFSSVVWVEDSLIVLKER